jgi:hypothetical protein
MLNLAQIFDMKRIGNREMAEGSDGNEARHLASRILHHASRIAHPASYSTTALFERFWRPGHEKTQTDTNRRQRHPKADLRHFGFRSRE